MLWNDTWVAPPIAEGDLQAVDARMVMVDAPALRDEGSGLPRCEPCGKTFKARKSFLRHLRTVHKQVVGKLPAIATNECAQCHLQFARKDLLLRHTKHQHSAGRRRVVSVEHRWPHDGWRSMQHHGLVFWVH